MDEETFVVGLLRPRNDYRYPEDVFVRIVKEETPFSFSVSVFSILLKNQLFIIIWSFLFRTSEKTFDLCP